MNMTPGDQTSSQACWCIEIFYRWTMKSQLEQRHLNLMYIHLLKMKPQLYAWNSWATKTFEYLGIFISSTSICSTLITETHCAQLRCHVHTCTLRICTCIYIVWFNRCQQNDSLSLSLSLSLCNLLIITILLKEQIMKQYQS